MIYLINKLYPFIFRYLLKTFSLAYNYVQPDIVIFLGDLMDEGSKASASEYKSYLHRFQHIFYPMKNSKVTDVNLYELTNWHKFNASILQQILDFDNLRDLK